MRVCYSWEYESWGIYEQTESNTLELREGFWETEPEALKRLDELNKEQDLNI